MASAVEVYRQKYAAFKAAERRITEAREHVNAVNEELGEWRRDLFANAGKLTEDKVKAIEHGIQSDVWPTAEELQQMLIKYARALDAAAKSWDQLAPNEREGLKPPRE